MNLPCYVVDDELHSVELLLDYIHRTDGLEVQGFSIDPVVALNEITGAGSPAITFLDVEMPQLSGLDLAGLVNHFTRVVITTSFKEFASDAYEKEAVDYLIKPISYERFLKCIQRIRRNFVPREPVKIGERDFFFIHTEIKGKIYKVIINDIVFVEGALNYIHIHLKNGKKLTPYLTMAEIEEFLPAKFFSRIHKSFIIRNDQILFIDNGEVTLENNVKLQIGKLYRKAFLEKMHDLVVKTKRKL